jgi:hypothetical protein
MTLFLCKLIDVCSNFDCPHRIPHEEIRNPRGMSMCIYPFSPSNRTLRLLRCFFCSEIHDDKGEEKAVYFIKKKRDDK